MSPQTTALPHMQHQTRQACTGTHRATHSRQACTGTHRTPRTRQTCTVTRVAHAVFGEMATGKWGAYWVHEGKVVGAFLESGTPEEFAAIKVGRHDLRGVQTTRWLWLVDREGGGIRREEGVCLLQLPD